MSLLPEWAPNLHPMIVHFPLALLIVAMVADGIALSTRRWSWVRPASIALYVVGGISAIVTYFTGRWAADTVGAVPAEVEPLLTEHADWGWWTMWFFGVYALVRLGAQRIESLRDNRAAEGVLFAVALAGLFILWETGEHGAQMVYRYGIGVQDTEQTSSAPQQTMKEAGAVGLVSNEKGWTWTPNTPAAWTKRTQWMGSPSGELRTRLVSTGQGGQALSLRMEQPGTLMFVVPDTLGDVQAEAVLNPGGFDGTVMLVHHVQNAQTYDFLALSDSTMQLGRMQEGNRTLLDETTFQASGWMTVRVTGDGTHFRGYVNGELVVHGHGDPLPPGRVGMQIDGRGPVLLQRMQARRLGN